MTRQLFLTYEDFLKTDKRSVNLVFSAILYDGLTDEYLAKVRLKDDNEDHAGKEFVMLEHTQLINWGEWLNIGIMNKCHPKLIDKTFLVTDIDVTLNEPCYIDQPVEYCMKIISDRRDRTEFVFLNRIWDWVIMKVQYVFMDDQLELNQYHTKHQRKARS